MCRTVCIALTSLVVLALAPLTVYGAGGSSAPTTPTFTSPEQLATDHYNRAIRARDKAWQLEEKLAAADSDKDRQKLEKKIEKQYKSALRAAQEAVEANPRMFQAQSTLGYLLRKTGDFNRSVQAYDRALAVNPGYSEAIEYRAEAHLALGQFEDVKRAYMMLFQGDRPKADQLMTALLGWAESDAATDQEDFSAWVEERASVAATTASLSRSGSTWSRR